MAKIITRFICPKCGIIQTFETWGISEMVFNKTELLKEAVINNHKKTGCRELIEKKVEYYYPKLCLNENIIYFDRQYKEFILNKIIKIEYDNENINYFIKDKYIGYYKPIYLNFEYNYIEHPTEDEVFSYNQLAYIDDTCDISYGDIITIDNIVENNNIIKHVMIDTTFVNK